MRYRFTIALLHKYTHTDHANTHYPLVSRHIKRTEFDFYFSFFSFDFRLACRNSAQVTGARRSYELFERNLNIHFSVATTLRLISIDLEADASRQHI